PLSPLASGAALFELRRRRLDGLETDRIASSGARVAMASAAMGASVAVTQRAAHLSHALNLALCIPLGIAVFYAAARAMRVPELEAVRNACYTAFRNASRPEAGDPPARHR